MTDARGRVIQTAIALRLYKHRHEEYPQTLDALTPALLDTVPIDPYTDQPLSYSRDGEGYLLYSIGPDLVDQKGSVPYDRDLHEPEDSYDLVHQVPR
jgi:hypothetical protein